MMDDGNSDEVEDDSFGWLWQGLDGGLMVAGIGLGVCGISVFFLCCEWLSSERNMCSGSACVRYR